MKFALILALLACLFVAAAQAKPATIECSVCEAVVNAVEGYLAENKTEAEIENLLEDDVCVIFGPAKDLCNSVVTTYLPEMIQFLEQDQSPQQVCTEISLCTSGVQPPMQALLKLRKPTAALKPLLKLSAVEPMQPLLKLRKVETTQLLSLKPVGGAVECSICKTIVNAVEGYVAENKTESEIAQLIDANVCKILGPLAGVCDTIVNTYLPDIISYVEQDQSPPQVCAEIDLCTTTTTTELLKLRMVQPATTELLKLRMVQPATTELLKLRMVEPVGGDALDLIAPEKLGSVECTICTALVNAVEGYLAENKTESEIEQLIDNDVCSILGPLQSLCSSIVNTYLPDMINYVEQDYGPQQTCTAIGLCTTSSPFQEPESENVSEDMIPMRIL